MMPNHGMFKHASENGDLKLQQYLERTFELSQKHVISGGNLRYACANGHLGALKYLTRAFKLDKTQYPEIIMPSYSLAGTETLNRNTHTYSHRRNF